MILIGKRIRRSIKWIVIIVVLALIYRHSPYQLEFMGNYDRVWAHRVNTKEKLKWSKPFFKGVELDLVFTADGILDVTHPPKPGVGLSLEEYFSLIEKEDQLQLWLDLKNLNAETAQPIFDRIELLLSNSEVQKNDLLIESTVPAGLLPFARAGYRCSFYLPQNLRDATQAKQDEAIQAVNALRSQFPDMGISSHFSDYYWMARHFPNAPKYLWFSGHSRINDYYRIREIFNDATVKVGLMRYNAIAGNR